ncbi:hypothetical protein CYMTET_11119 [Cymbomonas tetramitiformis]|uniref:MnmE helical domain-containing protein n=1 Tax=Cymbomonas tetramitiformis TaxID=36881 RepID=A0AAE0LDB4_9CHLO|nr:hypothetical protein CYMTET_11119 [Cymbomonas tetramitiformis]
MALTVLRYTSSEGWGARRGQGVEEVENELQKMLGMGTVQPEGALWAGSQRQVDALQQAAQSLVTLQETISMDMPLDLWTIELRGAALALGSITGEEITEDVLDSIFSRFCIGK